jgi:hypothetical protein
MRWNRGITSVLFVPLIIGGLAAILLLPLVLTVTTPPGPSADAASPELPPLPDLSAYEPEVKELIETTYLGRGREFPDPEEPAVVLRKYLEQNAHGYHSQLAEQGQRLNAELAAWQTLARQHPQSRHALVALAKHYRTKA